MIKLRTALFTLLKTLHPRVYFHVAPSTAVMPYVVYDFPNSFTQEEQERFVMDIDVWDDSTDTTALETLAETIWNTLHKHHHIDNDIQFSINRQTRFTMVDDDPRIRRRKQTYEIRYYDRGLNNG